MSEASFALTGMVHGSVGAAVLALLALAVWLERRGENRSFGSALSFASLLQLVQIVFGALQHAGYNAHLQHVVLARMPAIAWWLARKEHLAIGAVCLVWSSLASWWVGHRCAGSAYGAGFARSAAWSARLAAAMSLVVFALGSIVAAGIDHATAAH